MPRVERVGPHFSKALDAIYQLPADTTAVANGTTGEIGKRHRELVASLPLCASRENHFRANANHFGDTIGLLLPALDGAEADAGMSFDLRQESRRRHDGVVLAFGPALEVRFLVPLILLLARHADVDGDVLAHASPSG